MFNFRLINTPNGDQIIDRDLKTPYNALTPFQMLEYRETDKQLAFMDRKEKKRKRKKKFARNPLYILASMWKLL